MKIENAVVLAAGRGNRLRPLTDTIPKAMIEVGSRPILQWIVEGILAADVRKIVFVVGYREEAIRRYFGSGASWGAEFVYETQAVPNGPAGALKCAYPHVGRNFLVASGDCLFNKRAVRDVLDAPSENVVAVFRVADPWRYGVVELDSNGFCARIEEKPSHPKSNLIAAGIYKWNAAVWPCLDELQPSLRGELELAELVNALVRNGEIVSAVPLSYALDIGTPEALEEARAVLAIQSI